MSFYRNEVIGDYYKLLPVNETFVTHCSYCFRNLRQYKKKIMSFAHQEFNVHPFNSNNWIFYSHYCREKINSPEGYDENVTDLYKLVPKDERLRHLYDPSYTYDIRETSYTEKDLETLCKDKKNPIRRTPIE